MKRILPILWAVSFCISSTFLLFFLGDEENLRLFFFLFIGTSPVAFFLAYKFAIADLADEVFDNGDHLIFRKGPLKQTVELRDIINIRRARSSKNDKVIVTVLSTGSIGNKLTFLPEPRTFHFTEHPTITELRQRVEAARK